MLVCVCRVLLPYISTFSKQTEGEYENENRLVSEIKCVESPYAVANKENIQAFIVKGVEIKRRSCDRGNAVSRTDQV